MVNPNTSAPNTRRGPRHRAVVWGLRVGRRGAPVLLSLGLVAAATGALVAVHAGLAVAGVCMLLVVVAGSLLGYAPGLVAALFAFGCLTYFLTPPAGSFSIARIDDLFALTAFVAVSLVIGALLTRLTRLRIRAEQHAQEAELRVRILGRLIETSETDRVLEQAAAEIVRLFDLESCEFNIASTRVGVHGDHGIVRQLSIQAGMLQMQLGLGRTITSEEHASISALAMGLGAAFDRLQLKEELQERTLAEAVARSRAAFLSAVTHDLRTPLATIKAASAALRVEGSMLDGLERQELATTIYDESSDLEHLVTKVLDLTRIRAGNLRIEACHVNPVDVVAATVDRCKATAAARTVEVEIDRELAPISVDALMLDHALGNVIENALRYSAPSGPVTVQARRNDGNLEFVVADRGPGIGSEDRERVFDEFLRLGSYDWRGMGLGLPIARALVEAHDGRMWCEETPGGGATFVLSVPYREPEVVS